MPADPQETASKKVLVTGGTGFLGAHIVRHLVQSGMCVTVLVRAPVPGHDRDGSPVKYAVGDVTNLPSIVNAVTGADAVVYAAGVTSVSAARGRLRSYAVNVTGIQNIIDASKILGVRPSMIVLGTQADNPGIYAQTKRDGERLSLESNLDVTVVRPAFVYGPDQRSVFARLVGLIGKFPAFPIVGSGAFEMTPIYVEDVAAAITRCLVRPVSREVYLSGLDRVTFKEFATRIAIAIGRRPIFVHIPYGLVSNGVRIATKILPGLPVSMDTLRGLVQPRSYTPGASAEELGIPLTTLEAGFKKTFELLSLRRLHGSASPDRL